MVYSKNARKGIRVILNDLISDDDAFNRENTNLPSELLNRYIMTLYHLPFAAGWKWFVNKINIGKKQM
jgi:hypothetical protein